MYININEINGGWDLVLLPRDRYDLQRRLLAARSFAAAAANRGKARPLTSDPRAVNEAGESHGSVGAKHLRWPAPGGQVGRERADGQSSGRKSGNAPPPPPPPP